MISFCSLPSTSVEQRWQIPHDSLNRLVEPLKDLKAHGFDTLLQSLFSDLKVSGAPFSPAFLQKSGTGGKEVGAEAPPTSPPHTLCLRLVGGTAGRCSVAGDVQVMAP